MLIEDLEVRVIAPCERASTPATTSTLWAFTVRLTRRRHTRTAVAMLVKTESNLPIRDRADIKYPVHPLSTEQPGIDKERICAIRIILRRTGSSTRLSVW
jgi:hypothetical protein